MIRMSLNVGAVALADRGLALLDVADPIEPTLRCDLLIARASAARLTGAETIDDARRAFAEAVKLGDQERIGRALLSVSLRSTAASHIEHLDFLSRGLTLLDDTTLITRWNTEVALIVREFMIVAISGGADVKAEAAKADSAIEAILNG